MILEVAEMYIKAGVGKDFEAAMKKSLENYVSPTDGYIHGELQRSQEDPTRYLLMIQWETLEAHMVAFRESDRFPKHRELISQYFAKPPFVQHFAAV